MYCISILYGASSVRSHPTPCLDPISRGPSARVNRCGARQTGAYLQSPQKGYLTVDFRIFFFNFFLNTRNAEFFWLFTDDCRSSDHFFLASTKHDEFLYIFLPFVHICMTVFIPKSVKTTSKTESLPLQNQEKFLQVSLLFLSYIFIFTYQC